MAPETLNPSPRELKFGGERKSEQIGMGYAVTTLRNPRTSYDFRPGEAILADCFDDSVKVPVIVLSNETKKLWAFSNPQLMLDGFLSPDDVVSGMKEYKGYENLSINSELQAITFVRLETYNDLPEELQELLSSGAADFDTLVKNKELRGIFLPPICRRLTDNDNSIIEWMDYLLYNHFASWQEIDAIKKARLYVTNGDGGINYYDYHLRHPKAWEKLQDYPKAIVFQALVRMQPDEKLYH